MKSTHDIMESSLLSTHKSNPFHYKNRMKHSRNPQGKRWSCHTNIPTSSPSGGQAGKGSWHIGTFKKQDSDLPGDPHKAPRLPMQGAWVQSLMRGITHGSQLRACTLLLKDKGWRGPSRVRLSEDLLQPNKEIKNRSSNKIKLYILTSITVTLLKKSYRLE